MSFFKDNLPSEDRVLIKEQLYFGAVVLSILSKYVIVFSIVLFETIKPEPLPNEGCLKRNLIIFSMSDPWRNFFNLPIAWPHVSSIFITYLVLLQAAGLKKMPVKSIQLRIFGIFYKKLTFTPCLRLVRTMLKTWYLVKKYKHLCHFRKYSF